MGSHDGSASDGKGKQVSDLRILPFKQWMKEDIVDDFPGVSGVIPPDDVGSSITVTIDPSDVVEAAYLDGLTITADEASDLLKKHSPRIIWSMISSGFSKINSLIREEYPCD